MPFYGAGNFTYMHLWLHDDPEYNPGPMTPVTTIVTASPVSPSSTQVQITSDTQVGGSGSVDTTINIHYNDYDCLDIQKELGVVYLNPDQKYTIRGIPAQQPGQCECPASRRRR